MAKEQFSEEVTLPSRGILYPEGLLSGGALTLAMMGTAQEKLLAGSRGSAGKLITQLLDSLILSPKISSRDLLMMDRLFLLLKVRIFAFGSKYGFKMPCPSCAVTSRFEVDLADVESDELAEDFVEPFSLDLPISRQKVWLRLLRGFDDEAVTVAVKRAGDRGLSGPGDASYIPLMARMIDHTELIAEGDQAAKTLFCQGLKSMDSILIQEAVEAVKFGPDLNTVLYCPSCSGEVETQIPFGEEFFRPKFLRGVN